MRHPSTFLVTFFGLSSVLVHCQTPVSGAFAQALQEKLDSCVNVFNVPGISASILLPGDLFWNGASGLADIYTETPMDTAYLFQAASMTKLFTATIAMQLVNEGELSLDDTVGTYLPTLTYVPGDIKVRHLLKHRSGLADLLGDPDAVNSWLLSPSTDWDPYDALEAFGSAPLFAQGSAFSYSNTNYVLLGMIIEAVTGLPYHEVLRARILDPLGMQHTAFRPDEALPGAMVPGWSSLTSPGTYDQDMTGFLSPCFSSMVFAAGAMVCTPWDVTHFNRTLFTGGLLPAALTDTMQVCTNVNMGGGATGYGFGTMRYVFAGRTYYGHGGDINGFTQLTIHSPLDSVTLTLSINRNDAPRGPIAAAILDVVFQQLATVGIENGSCSDRGILLWPNPAKDEVFISSTDGGPLDRMMVMNSTGQVVRDLLNVNVGHQRVDLDGLVSGAYVVRIVRAGRVSNAKLLVQ